MNRLKMTVDSEQIRSFELAQSVVGRVISHWSYELAMAEMSAPSNAKVLAELETRWHEAIDLWHSLRPERPAQLAAVIAWYGPWVKRQLAQA